MTTSKGGQTLRGSVKWLRNKKRPGTFCWHARFTKPDRTRTRFVPIDPRIQHDTCCDTRSPTPCEHVRQARAAARVHAEEVRLSGGVANSVKETVHNYAKRWLADREGRVNSVRDDRGRMTHHVVPVLGNLNVLTFNRDDVERLRDALDRKIVKGDLSWKTIASVWTLVTSMCADMVSAKKREFRVRGDNPCRDVKPPERGSRKAKQYLYPSEFLKLVSCPEVPLRWRRVAALAVYTFARDGELRALGWDGDIDLEHGVLSVTRAFNERTGKVESTKTEETRRFALEPNVVPLLQAMHDEKKGQGTVVGWHERHMARGLRRWLMKAGVTRDELHHGSPTRKPMTWHDLRATGITWMAVRGDDPLKIKQRAGHATFSTTEIYIREAEAVREGFGEPFPPLPECLIGSVTVRDCGGTDAPIWLKNKAFRERDTGLEPATFGLGSRRSTN
jgi:integrase